MKAHTTRKPALPRTGSITRPIMMLTIPVIDN
jgi:hypothetical protein